MLDSRKPSALRVKCMTYNLNRGNGDHDFADSLFDQDIQDLIDLPDLYIFSFHRTFTFRLINNLHDSIDKIRELAALHLTFSSLTSSAIRRRQDAIVKAFSRGIGKIRKNRASSDRTHSDLPRYELVISRTYGGLGILIYARHDTIFPSIKRIEISRASCGFLSLMNNKGALGIRMTIVEPPDDDQILGSKKRSEEILTFVTAHLAAHDSGLMARNENYRTIVKRLLFDPLTHPSSSGSMMTIYDSTHLFFMGDLNYRIKLSNGDSKIEIDHLDHILRHGPYPSIVSNHDTLTQEHRQLNVLGGLREGPINFRPTYKYNPRSEDRWVNFEHRLPGWTDRIFLSSWNDHPGVRSESKTGSRMTEVRSYRSIQGQLGSDHKPVIGSFDIPDWYDHLPSQRYIRRAILSKGMIIEPDRWWRTKLWIGSIFDLVLGFGMIIVLVIGLGRYSIGIANILIALTAWKLRNMFWG